MQRPELRQQPENCRWTASRGRGLFVPFYNHEWLLCGTCPSRWKRPTNSKSWSVGDVSVHVNIHYLTNRYNTHRPASCVTPPKETEEILKDVDWGRKKRWFVYEERVWVESEFAFSPEYWREKKQFFDSAHPVKSAFLFVHQFWDSGVRLLRAPQTFFCLEKSLICERVPPAGRARCQNGLFDLETKRRRLMQLHHSRNESELQGKMVKAVEREQESRTSTAPLFFWVVPVRRCTRDRQTGRCKL